MCVACVGESGAPVSLWMSYKQGLSPDRLKSRGLSGVLVRCGSQEIVDVGASMQIRHLHPQEAAIMCGLHPCLEWGPEPRLALSGVGQIASPVQAMWVFQHLLCKLHFVKLDEWTLKPHAALLSYTSWFLARARLQWNFDLDMFAQSCQHAGIQVWGNTLWIPIALVDKFEQLQQQCTDLDAESSDKQESHACQTRDLTVTQIAIPSPSEAPDEDGEFCSIAIRIQEGMQQNEQAAEVLVIWNSHSTVG